jgi:DNA-directed RNA polymerase subunit omega
VAEKVESTEGKAGSVHIDSKFRFILIAAKRARQLQGGAKPLVPTISRKPTRVAQEELKSGVVKFELTPYVKRPEPGPPPRKEAK